MTSSNFASRLIESMKNAGHVSSRNSAGISLTYLAEVADCSHQMSRKYASGEALPAYQTIEKIAKSLGVDPGWLLFGNAIENRKNCSTTIALDQEILTHIFANSLELYKKYSEAQLIAIYKSVIYDINHIDADDETLHNVIDLVFKSFNHSPKQIPSKKYAHEAS